MTFDDNPYSCAFHQLFGYLLETDEECIAREKEEIKIATIKSRLDEKNYQEKKFYMKD